MVLITPATGSLSSGGSAPPGQDRDSLHILPLSSVPLQTPGLRKARLVKNTRLQGVVELFSGHQMGSGQIYPSELRKVFEFDERNEGDLEIVRALGKLTSYDVYSLRLQLRKLGIDVEDQESLRLSPEKVRQLSDYMRIFTAPIMAAIFGVREQQKKDYLDLRAVLTSDDNSPARQNLHVIAGRLNVHINEFPRILEDIGDIYLSLAYYQYCLNQNLPALSDFTKSIRALRRHPQFRDNYPFQQTCDMLEEKMRIVSAEVKNILDIFQVRTCEMWENPSRREFDRMLRMVTDYQAKIGGALCAITVKMNAWRSAFDSEYEDEDENSSPLRRADFIMTEMRHGIESIEHVKYSDEV